MKFWASGCTPSKEHSYLTDVYGIPDYVTNVESVFRVKHGVFSWSVINLSDFPEARSAGGVFCHSPSFRLQETAWCLQLCPRATVDGRRGVSLRLMREASDSGPEKVLASYRLGVGNFSNSVWFEARESTFWKGNFFQLNTSVLGYLEDFFDDGVDYATVVCEIYASYFPTAGVDGAGEISEIDESLPADMSALLASHRTMDVPIEVRGHQVWAHKSLLSARSKTLGDRLEHCKFLQLSCSLPCLKCVLAYMYSGSFDYLARNAYFSVGLYELADELCLLPLMELLCPDKKGNKTRIHVQSFEEVCRTQFNVRSFFANATFKTQKCFPKRSGLRLSVTIYKIGHLPNYCAAFKLQIFGIGGGFHGETSLSVLNRHGKGVAARFLSQELDPSGSSLTSIFVLTAAEFMSCNVAFGSIAVHVAFRVYQMRHDQVRSFDFERKMPVRKPLEPRYWRDQLAQDLKTLLHRGQFSDASGVVGDLSFAVHRPILAARSPHFHSLFYGGNGTPDVFLIVDVTPRTFWLTLNYVYCGTLSHFSDLTLEDFAQLYRASLNFGLSSLLGISSLFLKMMTGELNFVDP